LAPWDEIVELVDVVGRESTAAFQLAPEPLDRFDAEATSDYFLRLQRLSIESRVPVVFGVAATDKWLTSVSLIDETVARGGEMYGLSNCRGPSTIQSFRTRLSFDRLPEWNTVRSRPLHEQRLLLLDPRVRQRLVGAAHHGDYGNAVGAEPRQPDYDHVYIMYSPYLPNPSVAEEARRRGIDPVEVMIDVALEHDFDVFFHQQRIPQRDDDLLALLRNPNIAMTFSDAGAHVSQICDASIQTHLLAYWVRERQAIPLHDAICMMTSRPAAIWRLRDRGMLKPGFAADVTVFDPDTVAPLMPRVVADLPDGSPRLEQRAQGYVATIVNGEVLTRDGQPTEARPGRLLRAAPTR
jgi:N-acyl-D-aspartate/D-glutamate deacylase